VAISGDTIVAGARGTDVGGNVDQGAVYVFVKPAGGWNNSVELAKLTASDGGPGDRLGTSVAIFGDVIVAGAPRADVNGVDDRGAVYVFVKPPGGWVNGTQSAKLVSSDGVANDALGLSSAISGDVIVGGAGGVDSEGIPGAAYVFEKPATGWADATETGKLTATDATGDAQLGYSVAIDADTIVAGAPQANRLPGPDTDWGAVYVFEKPPAGWVTATETAKLTTTATTEQSLGRGVAVSGDTIVGGAPDGSGFGQGGAAYVFVRPPGGWAPGTQTARLTATGAQFLDVFGEAVAIAGDTVVAGARGWPGGDFVGHAFVFVRPQAGWTSVTQTASLRASDAAVNDQLGTSVAILSDTVVAGVPDKTISGNSFQGAAYVFEKPGGGWSGGPQLQNAKLTSGAPTAVALRSFTARPARTGVVLRWRTAQETEVVGFNLYRRRHSGHTKMNRVLIPAQFTGRANGGTYRWLDRGSRSRAPREYRLQAVQLSGTKVWLGIARS
jgi:hypothetical protein